MIHYHYLRFFSATLWGRSEKRTTSSSFPSLAQSQISSVPVTPVQKQEEGKRMQVGPPHTAPTKPDGLSHSDPCSGNPLPNCKSLPKNPLHPAPGTYISHCQKMLPISNSSPYTEFHFVWPSRLFLVFSDAFLCIPVPPFLPSCLLPSFSPCFLSFSLPLHPSLPPFLFFLSFSS